MHLGPMMRCPQCPCPADVVCLSGRFPVFCDWARDGIPSGLLLIVSRSRRGNSDLAEDPSQQTDQADDEKRRADAEATRARMELHRRIRSCPEIDVHCGCDFPTCHAGRGDHDGGARTSPENCVRCLGLA